MFLNIIIMYSVLLFLHSFGRWLVLVSLFSAMLIAFAGLRMDRRFSGTVNAWRHWTATIAHVQLLLGMLLYFQSPLVRHNVPHDGGHVANEHIFFRYVHITIMFIAVIVITIGSAKAKRIEDDRGKYRTMFVWYAAGLLILLIAVPWPFSPLAARPLLRSY